MGGFGGGGPAQMMQRMDSMMTQMMGDPREDMRTMMRGGSMGRGGMESKVKAARYLTRRGIPCVIGNGTTNIKARTILQVARGKEIGTLFVPQKAA